MDALDGRNERQSLNRLVDVLTHSMDTTEERRSNMRGDVADLIETGLESHVDWMRMDFEELRAVAVSREVSSWLSCFALEPSASSFIPLSKIQILDAVVAIDHS